MDRNKSAFYGGIVFSIAINIIITVGLIITRHDKFFWLFIFLLSAINSYGIITMFSWNIDIKTGQKHTDSQLCNCDGCKNARLNTIRNTQNKSVPSSIQFIKIRPWFDCYMSLGSILLRTRLHEKQLPEEIEKYFASIADLYWNKMTEQEQNQAEEMSNRQKEYYDKLAKELEKDDESEK